MARRSISDDMVAILVPFVLPLIGIYILLNPDPTPAPFPPDPAQQIVAVVLIVAGTFAIAIVAQQTWRNRR